MAEPEVETRGQAHWARSAELSGDRDPFELALAYLNRRERTEAEVRGHLRGKRIDDHALEAIMDRLRECGLVDDTRFARVFCEDKRNLELWGRERIGRALRARGIADALLDQALAELAGGSEMELALQILRRRFPGGIEPGGRERAFGVLIRKGFDPELASDALRAHGRVDGCAA